MNRDKVINSAQQILKHATTYSDYFASQGRPEPRFDSDSFPEPKIASVNDCSVRSTDTGKLRATRPDSRAGRHC